MSNMSASTTVSPGREVRRFSGMIGTARDDTGYPLAARRRPSAPICAIRFAPYFFRPAAAAIAAPLAPPPALAATAAKRDPEPSCPFGWYEAICPVYSEAPANLAG